MSVPESLGCLGERDLCLSLEVGQVEVLTIFLCVKVFSQHDVLLACSQECALSKGFQVVAVSQAVVSKLFLLAKGSVFHLLNLSLASCNEAESNEVELLVGLLSVETQS